MKPIKQTLVSGAMMLALSLVFTSCEDILGEWSRPAPNPVTPTPEPEPTPAGTYRVYTSGTAYTDEPIPAGAIAVETSAAVTWSAGTYVVSSDVSISGEITLDGNVNLILCDGAELTVKGRIVGGDKSLNIYGQTAGTGKLTMNGVGSHNIYVKYLQIHGGDITGTNSEHALFTNGTLKIYHGNISATAVNFGLVANGNLSIYGGTITASSTAADAVFVNDASMEMTGGSLTATATASGTAGVKVDHDIDIFGGTIIATGGPSGEGFIGTLTNKTGASLNIGSKANVGDAWTVEPVANDAAATQFARYMILPKP